MVLPPLKDNLPGEIASPFAVKPFSLRQKGAGVRSPRDDALSDSEAKVSEQDELAAPSSVTKPGQRYIPRQIRREQEQSKKLAEEQRELHASGAAEDFKLEFGADDDEEDNILLDLNSPVRWATKPRNKPQPKQPFVPPYDVASVAAIILKHDINAATTTRRPVARPLMQDVRIPKETQRRKMAEKLMKQRAEEERQRLQDDSFCIEYGDSDTEKDAEKLPKKEAKPTLADVVGPAAAISKFNRNLRVMKAATRRKRRLEAEREEQRANDAAEEDFDLNEVLFGDDGADEASEGILSDDKESISAKMRAAAGAQLEPLNVEQRYMGEQSRALLRPASSSLLRKPGTGYGPSPFGAGAGAGAGDELQRAMSASSTTRASREAAIDAAQRAQNISRLNRVIVMNNFINNRSPPSKVPPAALVASSAAMALPTSPLQTARTPHTGSTGLAPAAAATGAPTTPAPSKGQSVGSAMQAPLSSRRSRESKALREEQERKREEEEKAEWDMMNDDLFEQENLNDADD
jgi:hypothetical protein